MLMSSTNGPVLGEGLLQAADPTDRPPLCSRSLQYAIAGGVAVVSAFFALMVGIAPSEQSVCHRLNLTIEGSQILCVEGVEGPICPAQAKNCKVLGDVSYLIQFTEACFIACLLIMLWKCEKPRRRGMQFVADNSKSILLSLMTHFLVLSASAPHEPVPCSRLSP